MRFHIITALLISSAVVSCAATQQNTAAPVPESGPVTPPGHAMLFDQLLNENIVLSKTNSHGCSSESKQDNLEFLDDLIKSYLAQSEYQRTTCYRAVPGWRCETSIGDNSGDERKEFAIILKYDASDKGVILTRTLTCHFAG